MLHIKNLHKSYGAFEVLKGLDMNVNKGDIYGFLGKNGCGKTTTMNIVSNIIPKDSGEIIFGKENCKVGYLPETPSMFTYMNGYEYLDYIAACCSYKGDKKKRIDEVINLVGMAEGGKRRIKGYSRGMNQRIGIAAAIFDNPDLLILDEPTSALDPQGRAEVMNIIKQLADMGTTIILCTHILSDVERTANRIGIVRDGRMAVEGTMAEIKDQFARNDKKIIMGIFGDPNSAIQSVNKCTGGRFYFDRQRAIFEIPLEYDDNEQIKAQQIINEINSAGLTLSLFVIENKTLEQIYMDTIG
jgi:ABC-2 type transport system ATP-binding protein